MSHIFAEKEVPQIRHASLIFAIGLGIPFGASITFAYNVVVYSVIAIVLQLKECIFFSNTASCDLKGLDVSLFLLRSG
jgi:hypothetical protein